MCDDDIDARKSSCEGFNYQSVPDADREIAAQALLEFESQKYGQSLSSMKKLLSKRPLDTKVFHNASVVEFYLSNSKKTEQLNKKLVEVCKQAHIDINDIEALDDVDYCVVLYNQSVVLFHLHQYHAAIGILDKVFQYIEPLEETLARNICFLLLECYQNINQLKKAVYLIGYLEGMMFGAAAKTTTKPNQKEKDSQKDESSDAFITETVKRKLQLCKARCYAMMKTSKACKREIKNLMSSGSNVQNIPAFYLKSQLEYQRGNYRKALKLLNSVTLPDDISKYFKETGDYLPAIFYNNVGCIHFYMGKPNLGAFYTEKALQAFESEMKAITSKASNTEKLNCRPLHQMSMSTRHQLLYNLGLQFFGAQKYTKAFDCFVEVVRSFPSNPRLWLRIAECCIQLHKPDSLEDYVEYKGKPFVKTVVGSGPHRKAVMNSTSEKLAGHSPSSIPDDPKSPVKPNLHFAMLCLKNALFLVGEYSYRAGRSDNANAEPDDDSELEYRTVPVLPSNSVQDCDAMYLRNSIIVACSYVALCLGDVRLALEYTHMLYLQPLISASHKFFCHMYGGEALLIMDRITDAVDNFTLDWLSRNHSIELAESSSSQAATEHSLKHQCRFDPKYMDNLDGSRPIGNLPRWFPDTLITARFVSHYNLAVAYAVREEWSKALESLQQINVDQSIPPQAMSLLMYIHCHQGSVDDIDNYVNKYLQPAKQ